MGLASGRKIKRWFGKRKVQRSKYWKNRESFRSEGWEIMRWEDREGIKTLRVTRSRKISYTFGPEMDHPRAFKEKYKKILRKLQEICGNLRKSFYKLCAKFSQDFLKNWKHFLKTIFFQISLNFSTFYYNFQYISKFKIILKSSKTCFNMCVCVCVCVYIYIYICVCVCVCVYRILPTEAVCVLAGIFPNWTRQWLSVRGYTAHTLDNSGSGKAQWAKSDERQITLGKWDERLFGDSKEEWTRLLICNFKAWLERNHG